MFVYNFVLALLLISSTLAGHIHRTARHHNGENHTHEHEIPPAADSVKTDPALPPVAEARPVELNYLKAFRGFSENLIKQPYYYQSLVNSGAVCYCPFTLGFLLAAVNEKALDVPTDGIAKVLRLSPENVTNAYSGIADSFLEDVKVKASSFLYTQNQAIQLSPAYKRLHTEKATLQLDGNSEAAAGYINGQIAKSTRNAIVNRLLPKEPQFNNATAGVFVNTFYYKSGWDTSLVSIGKQPFYVNSNEVKSTETLEGNGRLRVLQTENYDAVSLPLLGGRKRVVLVQPKNITLKDYILRHSQEVFESCPRDWRRRQAKVQFPALNLVLGRDFHEQLNELAGSKIQCNKSSSNSNYIQPVVQVGSFKICPEMYELTITNGVQVNRVESEPLKEVKTSITSATKPETSKPVKVARQILDDEEELPEPEEPAVEDLPPISLTFDKPFFMYLHDNNLGAVSFAAVESFFDTSIDTTPEPVLPKARHHIQKVDDAKNFSELIKMERWSCNVPH